MNYTIPVTGSSIYESLQGFTTVSGASIVSTTSFQIVEVRSLTDLQGAFTFLSSSALCFGIIALYFYKRFLDLFKGLVNSLLSRR